MWPGGWELIQVYVYRPNPPAVSHVAPQPSNVPPHAHTPPRAFGAPGHLRLSYGSLPEAESMAAFDRLDAGLALLVERAGAAAGSMTGYID